MIVIDTNVLVAFLDAAHPNYERAFHFFQSLSEHDEKIAIPPQTIGEAFVVMTSRRYADEPIPASRFRSLIQPFLESTSTSMISPGRAAIEHAMQAAVEKNVASAQIFDLLLYGTMREHDVTRLATFNVKHFSGLEGIELVAIP